MKLFLSCNLNWTPTRPSPNQILAAVSLASFGQLWLTVKPTVYSTISVVPLVLPPNPADAPIVPAGFTSSQMLNIWCKFAQDTLLSERFTMVDRKLKQRLIAPVDEIFIKYLRNKYVSYGGQTTKQLLSHIYNVYANITVGYLQAKNVAMKQV